MDGIWPFATDSTFVIVFGSISRSKSGKAIILLVMCSIGDHHRPLKNSSAAQSALARITIFGSNFQEGTMEI